MGQHRITIKMLELRAEKINKVLGMPLTYSSEINGIRQTNIGHFHIDEAYGGFSLQQTDNDMGGVSDVFNAGHMPARDLFNRMCAFLDGVRAAREVTA